MSLIHLGLLCVAGYTPLGSGLEAKCIIPFVITPARNNFLKKPVLVSAICNANSSQLSLAAAAMTLLNLEKVCI